MPPPRGLVQWVDQSLHRSSLLPRGSRLLVAVSGGADSVALLRLLVAINGSDHWGWTLIVGHVDHGMRGKASTADAKFVRKLARELKLAYVEKKLHLKAGASEEAAREGRLRALKDMVRAKQCIGVVMAHHADDQAETVLMRLFRGCGLEGLGGMGAFSDVEGLLIFRPLIEVRRNALRGYLNEIGQSWREDASNESAQYLRNRVRAALLPLIEGMWPGAVEAMSRLSLMARESHDVVTGLSMTLAKYVQVKRSAGQVYLKREQLRRVSPLILGELLRMVIEHLGGTREIADFERIREAVHKVKGNEGGWRIELGRGIEVSTESGMVRVARVAKRSRRRKVAHG